ncbi:MAG: hypothetical protein FWF47_05165, partial [Clostridia bacterium]|nr:hypothetical protein [Clostridia bacterium]
MITNQALRQTLVKLERMAAMLHERIFEQVDEATLLGFCQTSEPLHTPPQSKDYSLPPPDNQWGG